jgi:hypothetical protein
VLMKMIVVLLRLGRPRVAATACLFAIAAALSACGSSSGPAASSTSPAHTTVQGAPSIAGEAAPNNQQQIRTLFGRYMQAVASGDGQTACSLLTASAQHLLATASGGTSLSCGELFTRARSAMSQALIHKLLAARVTSVNVEGATALLHFNVGGPDRAVHVREVSGRWLIDTQQQDTGL